MTKEQVVEAINAQERWCRGPLLIQEPMLNIYRSLLKMAIDANSEAALVALKQAMEQLHGVPEKKDCTTLPELEMRCVEMIFARADLYGRSKACGYNVNQILLEGACDGEMHKFTCPRCGTPDGTYILPKVTE